MNELSLHILDICQNSIRANATLIDIVVEEDTAANRFQITITDNGSGMNEQTLSGVADPFYTTRTTRKVGLGVSLFKMAAEMAGGNLSIRSQLGHGTTIVATFEHNHIDRAPLGDIAETLMILIMNEASIDIRYQHTYNGYEYLMDTREIKSYLEGIPLTDYDVIMWVKNNIQRGLETIHKEESM